MTETKVSGVDISQYFSNPEYRAAVDAYRNQYPGQLKSLDEALSTAASTGQYGGINAGGRVINFVLCPFWWPGAQRRGSKSQWLTAAR
jgi:hypothetical protein